MIKDTVTKIEEAIQKLGKADHKKKDELLRLLSKLKTEIGQLSKADDERAQSIAAFTEVATHEATRKKREPELEKSALEGLSSSVKGFEASHPDLARTVNDICNLLSGIGI